MSPRLPDLVKVGTLLLVTRGKSDDYRPLCVARAARDLDLSTLRVAFVAALLEWQRACGFAIDTDFLQWLLEQGHLEEVPVVELWIDGWHGAEWPAEDAVRPWEACVQSWWWEKPR